MEPGKTESPVRADVRSRLRPRREIPPIQPPPTPRQFASLRLAGASLARVAPGVHPANLAQFMFHSSGRSGPGRFFRPSARTLGRPAHRRLSTDEIGVARLLRRAFAFREFILSISSASNFGSTPELSYKAHPSTKSLIDLLEVAPAGVEPSANHRLGHVVPSFQHALRDASDRHLGRRQPQEEQLDPVALLPPKWNPARIAPTAQRRFESEALTLQRVFADLTQNQPASLYAGPIRTKWIQAGGDEIRC